MSVDKDDLYLRAFDPDRRGGFEGGHGADRIGGYTLCTFCGCPLRKSRWACEACVGRYDIKGENLTEEKSSDGIESGDLITFTDRPGEVSIVEKPPPGGVIKALTDGAPAIVSESKILKISKLVPELYLRLARRTIPGDMTRKERLSMLAFGLIGELGEVQAAAGEGSSDRVLSECGDVLWYASILQDEAAGGYSRWIDLYGVEDWLGLIEDIKKEIFHGAKEGTLASMACSALVSVQRLIRYHEGDIGEVRLANIKKLYARYPDGFK